jgi:hypothetical protein
MLPNLEVQEVVICVNAAVKPLLLAVAAALQRVGALGR